MKVADLSQDQLDKVKELEGELGIRLVAMEYTSNLADLNEGQLDKVQSLEDELGVVLVAHSD